MKRTHFLPVLVVGGIFAACELATQAAPAQRTKSASAKQTAGAHRVSLYVDELFSEGPPRPSALLAQALTKHPKAEFFTITWGTHGTLGTDDCVAHYNRRTHTFRMSLYSHWFENKDDDKSDVTIMSHTRERWKYTRVTDAALKKLAARNANNYNGDGNTVGFFTQLPKFGCWGRKVQSTTKFTRTKR